MSDELTLVRVSKNGWQCQKCGITFDKSLIDADSNFVYKIHQKKHELIKGEK
jgi:ribosomal protein L37AE/L43A